MVVGRTRAPSWVVIVMVFIFFVQWKILRSDFLEEIQIWGDRMTLFLHCGDLNVMWSLIAKLVYSLKIQPGPIRPA
jgi:hypothetical protein